METFLLKYYSVSLFFQCMMGVIGIVVLVYYLILLLRELYLNWREKKAKQKEGCQQQEKRIWLPEPPVLLSPKERREYMLNHIEDGRFYEITSLRNSETCILCDFLGKKRLRIDLDRNPRCVVFEGENISPYIVDRDYNTFVQSLQATGFDWKIEKGEENILGSYTYLLKETRTK